MSKVSIIIPVYNVREYLVRCIDSILVQTMSDIEIIIVNDGSTDGSGDICDEYKKKDKRIKVIHKKNGGLSEARNVGIKEAISEYILFVDSDDYIHPETCEKLYGKASELDCDIVGANEVKVVNGKNAHGARLGALEKDILSGKDFLVKAIISKCMAMCAPFAMYRRTLIIDNKLYFKEGILHEDEWWTPQIYLKAKKVSSIDFDFYYHWYREDSITHSTNKEKNTKDVIDTCNELSIIYSELDKYSKKYLCDYLCMLYLNSLFMSKKTDADRKFAMRMAGTVKNRLKAYLYFVSPSIYMAINICCKRGR